MKTTTTDMEFTHLDVDVYTQTIIIPTYAQGPRDPNPPLFGKGTRAIYPYPWQKSFTTEIEEKTYDAMVLKSRWMELTILPDWGMHLYRAVDLYTGRDLFHCPKVMKPANNAIRGAYVAGGVEFNFPVGHNAMTWSRAGVHIRKTSEGVQALFHHLDQRSGMTIMAGVTLAGNYRGIYFDQYFYNGTPLPQPWYYWLNAGIAPHPSLRFLFPTDTMIGHFEGPFLETRTKYPYPVREGIDYSRYDKIPEPIGLFSPGGVSGWFGAWYEDWNFGVIRWAPPWQVAGQKFWAWGNSEEGLLWGQIAADQELPIPEIQSGRPETQMDRGILLPYASISHREWWMPVSEIGDIQTGSEYGAMAIREKGEQTEVAISPAWKIKDVHMRVNNAKAGETFDLEPGHPCFLSILLPKETLQKLEIVGADGSILTWSEKKGPVAANIESLYDHPIPMKEMSAEQLFQRGYHYERTQRLDLAEKFYRLCLDKDTGFSKSRLHMGFLKMLREDLDGAIRELDLALKADRWNDEALYLHGLASFWKGDVDQAQIDFCRVAATGTNYVVPALVQLALEAHRRKEYHRAGMIVDHGLEISSNNAALRFLQALDFRRRGDLEGYSRSLASVPCIFDRADDDLYVPGDRETEDGLLIACALRFLECGSLEDAVECLKKVCSEVGVTKAGYLLKWLGKNPSFGKGRARFFGWGREMKLALEHSLQTDPVDGTAHFALGCLLAEIGQFDSAVAHLRKSCEIEPENSISRTALGIVYREKGDLNAAIIELQQAIDLEPINPTAWIQLDLALKLTGKRNTAWLKRFSGAPEEVLADEESRITLAESYADAGEYDPAANLLTGRIFHPYELTHHLRNLWVRIHRQKAIRLALAGDYAGSWDAIGKALDYPQNLGMGKPLRRFDARTLYTAGCLFERMDNTLEAKKYFAQAAGENQPDPTLAKPWSILAMIKLGDKDMAMKRLEGNRSEAHRYLDALFNPDLDDDLKEIIHLCDRIKSGWVPSLEELQKEDV